MTDHAHPLLTRIRRVGRSVVPESIRIQLRHWMFASMGLTWQTRSGIQLRVEQYNDWSIHNEIFVDGDYDQAIALALDSSPRHPLHIVDLGANVGFFTLRAFDRLHERGLARKSMTITAIEGDSHWAADYEFRVFKENGLRSHVQLVRGMVGRGTGTGRLVKDSWTATERTKHARMPYLDLALVLAATDRIDLLKCDIEGAEEDLIESYPDVFARTNVAVFEFHATRCNVERCRALLREYGFVHETTRRPESDYSLCTVWR